MPYATSALADIHAWLPSPSAVREALLDYRITVAALSDDGFTPAPAAAEQMPSEAELEAIAQCAHDAVLAGRFIAFGDWSNDAIKRGGKRGGQLWNAGALGSPFRASWVFMHSWDPAAANDAAQAAALGLEREARAIAVYVVRPCGDDEIWVCELLPQRFDGVAMLELGDRALLHRCDGDHRYNATVAPALSRWMVAQLHSGMGDIYDDAAANVIDPLALALLMLGTRGVERRTMVPSAKLQRARARSGKPALPSWEEVFSAPYITALTLSGSRRERGADAGGSHRSPTPHIRRGHPRDYATGVRVMIQDTLVNVPPEQRARWKAGRRSHYEVKGMAP